jgi:hypothetical protein
VLKPGGIASFSTEYLISGDPLAFEDQTIMFTEELIDRVIRGQRDWSLMAPIDYTISPATLATEIDIDEYLGRPEPTYPHCVLRIGDNVLTSVHIAFRKAAPAPVDRSPSVVAARPSPSAPAPSGDTQHSRVSTSARRQRLMQLLRWLLRRPYHPLLWRLERNHQQSLALEARLAELSQRLDRSTERFDRQLADVGQISRRASQSAREAVEVAKAGTEANRTTLAEWAAVIARTVRQRGRGD